MIQKARASIAFPAALILTASCGGVSHSPDNLQSKPGAPLTAAVDPDTPDTDPSHNSDALVAHNARALLDCIDANDIEGIAALMGSAPDIKALVPEGSLLLHRASRAMGHNPEASAMISYLLEKKAYVYQRDEKGKTPFDILADHELGESPRYDQLIASVGPVIRSWESALKRDALQEMMALLDRVDARDWLVLEALTWKAPRILDWAIESGYRTDAPGTSIALLLSDITNPVPTESVLNHMIKTALEAGVPVDAPGASGHTPTRLVFNSDTGHESTALLLLEAGASDAPEPMFTDAVRKKWFKVGDYLIATGIELKPYFVAVATLETLPWLLSKGYEPESFFGPVRVMNADDQKKAIQLLLDEGLPEATLNFKWVGKNIENITYLRSLGLSPAGSDIVAILVQGKRSLEEVQEYLTLGADPNARIDYGSNTPLHMAVMSDDLALVKLLVSYGADVNATNRYGRSALSYCRSASHKMKKFLVKSGAK